MTSPEIGFVSYDAEFTKVLGADARLVKVVDTDAHEGPVYVAAEDALYFTTLPKLVDVPAPGYRQVSIKRVRLDADRFPLGPERIEVVRAEANNANGMARAGDGTLVVCEQGSRSRPAAITHFQPAAGATEVVVDNWQGLPLNSPNDVVVRSDGSVWFTDPTYGYLQGFRPEPLAGDYVYRWDAVSRRVSVVADSFDKPNGIAFSPDERVLYVTDSGANQAPGTYCVNRPHHIIAYDVAAGRYLVNARLFAVTTPGFPDGLKVDSEGRVYASSFSGVQVFDPTGDLLGEIRLPGAVNFAFGGAESNVLFITTDTAVWAAVLAAHGPQPTYFDRKGS